MNKTIFFSGIGGAGLSALALLARDCGYKVAGSDTETSNSIERLKKSGIEVYLGQNQETLAKYNQKNKIDWLIRSSAIPDEHPEINFAKNNAIKISKRDELLNEIIRHKNLKLIAISGTHGKTTLTGILIWIFKQLDIPISYSIGTNISYGPSAAYENNAEYFIYEADEYDKNFLNFHPVISVIPSLDYDHPDTFPNQEDYKKAFRQFIAQSRAIYTWREVSNYLDLKTNSKLQIFNYDDVQMSDFQLAGIHNRRHAFLVLKIINDLFPFYAKHSTLSAVNAFPGTERRFEKLTDNLYTDYAHHPNEIAATLQLANELSKDIVVVYQPHQNRRQHTLQGQYKDSFTKAKKVYWLPTYLTREDPKQKVLSPNELITRLSTPSHAEPADMNDDLVTNINNHLKQNDLVIIMGAGPIDGWGRKNLTEFHA